MLLIHLQHCHGVLGKNVRFSQVIKHIYDNKKSHSNRNFRLWIVGFYLILKLFLISKCPIYIKCESRGLDGFRGISLKHKSKTTAPHEKSGNFQSIRIYPLQRKNLDLIPTVVQPCHSKQINAGYIEKNLKMCVRHTARHTARPAEITVRWWEIACNKVPAKI